jgi:tripartite-type tricarboxylate transporter receptor subunit TctC
MDISRAASRLFAAALMLTATVSATAAQTGSYPSRPIQVIIPFAAGSASDVVSRIMLDKMSEALGQPFIVENKAGANGNTGTMMAARAAPDGYTLVAGGSGPVAANVALYKLGYDPLKDLEIISPFASFTMVVAASKALPVKSLQELIAYAKAHPGLNYGSVGVGSSQHLAGELFSHVTGVKLTHVPYRNIAQYVPDLMAGLVPLGFQWYPNVAGALQAKGANALAVAGENRLAVLPDTPTTAEAGVPQYKMGGWFALLAPAGTPRPILERLNREMAAALKDAKVREAFGNAGAEPMALGLEQAKQFQAAEIAQYREIITRAGINPTE